MTPQQRSALDREHEQLDAVITALPSDVREAVELMRLGKALAQALLNLEAASVPDRLTEVAATANAYIFAAWHYEEITEEQWRLLRDYTASRRDLRREQ